MLGKLTRAGVLLEPLAFRGELLEAPAVGVAENRDEQAVLERDREADVRRVARHELSVVDPRPKPRMIAKRLRRGRDDDIGVRGAGRFALRVRLGHIDVARDSELGLLADALGHALADGLAHAR